MKIQLTKGYKAIIDKEDFEKVNKYSWHFSNGYPYARINHKLIKIDRYILGQENNKLHIDHINGDGLDNRKSNLRMVTRSQNMMNKRKKQTCFGTPTSSKFKGVFWEKGCKKWRVQVTLNKKRHHIGLFVNELDAAIAYDQAATKMFGEYALTNNVRKVG